MYGSSGVILLFCWQVLPALPLTTFNCLFPGLFKLQLQSYITNGSRSSSNCYIIFLFCQFPSDRFSCAWDTEFLPSAAVHFLLSPHFSSHVKKHYSSFLLPCFSNSAGMLYLLFLKFFIAFMAVRRSWSSGTLQWWKGVSVPLWVIGDCQNSCTTFTYLCLLIYNHPFFILN